MCFEISTSRRCLQAVDFLRELRGYVLPHYVTHLTKKVVIDVTTRKRLTGKLALDWRGMSLDCRADHPVILRTASFDCKIFSAKIFATFIYDVCYIVLCLYGGILWKINKLLTCNTDADNMT